MELTRRSVILSALRLAMGAKDLAAPPVILTLSEAKGKDLPIATTRSFGPTTDNDGPQDDEGLLAAHDGPQDDDGGLAAHGGPRARA